MKLLYNRKQLNSEDAFKEYLMTRLKLQNNLNVEMIKQKEKKS